MTDIVIVTSNKLLAATAVLLLGIASAAAQVYQPPIVITAGGTYSGDWLSTDPATPAVTVRTTQPVVLTASNIQSVGTFIRVEPGASVTVTNIYGLGLNPGVAGLSIGRFVDAEAPASLVVEHNDLSNTAGIYVLGSVPVGAHIAIRFNRVENINGRLSTGSGYQTADTANTALVQFVQFDKVVAPTAEVAWNQVVNDPYVSRVEDNINMYQSCGTATTPILIHDNYIRGGYPGDPDHDGYSGGGIISDGSVSCHLEVYGNQVIETTNYGIAVAGGSYNNLNGNVLMGIGRLPDGVVEPAQNVGGYVSGGGTNNTFHDNQVGWYNASGSGNNWWLPSCPSPTCDFNNVSLLPITQDQEAAQLTVWQNKLVAAGLTVGPCSSTSCPAPPTSGGTPPPPPPTHRRRG